MSTAIVYGGFRDGNSSIDYGKEKLSRRFAKLADQPHEKASKKKNGCIQKRKEVCLSNRMDINIWIVNGTQKSGREISERDR